MHLTDLHYFKEKCIFIFVEGDLNGSQVLCEQGGAVNPILPLQQSWFLPCTLSRIPWRICVDSLLSAGRWVRAWIPWSRMRRGLAGRTLVVDA